MHRHVLYAACMLLLLAACAEQKIKVPAAEDAIPVHTHIVEIQPFHQTLSLSGRILSGREFVVVTQHDMLIEDLHVGGGESVRKGDPLVTLAFPLSAEAGNQPEQSFVNRVPSLSPERARALINGAQTGAVTMLELQQAMHQLVRDAPDQFPATGVLPDSGMGPGTVYAPFDGTVSSISVERDSLVVAGQPLLRVQNADAVTIEVPISSAQFSHVREGMAASVWLAPGAEPVPVVLLEISRKVRPEGRLYEARFALHDPEVHDPEVHDPAPGSFVRVELDLFTDEEALLVPVEAVFFRQSVPFVYAAVDGQARLTAVSLGGRQDGYYRVTAGLSAGDLVITEGRDIVTDGRRIYVP